MNNLIIYYKMVMNVSNQLTNRDQGGGSKKAGLVSLIGKSRPLARLIKTRTYSPSPFTIINSVSVCPTKEVDTGTVVFNENGISGPFFSTNEELKIFRGCTKINGDLVIIGFTTDEIDFSVFDCLQEITGSFIITKNAELKTISGFGNLERVGGIFNAANLEIISGFAITENDKLTTISGFVKLKELGGGFGIGENPELTTIPDFVNLQTVGGGFGIIENAKLTTISGFVNLETVGGNLEIVGRYFQISGNVLLTTLSGFVKLQTVGEYFSIFDNGGSVNTAVGVTVVLTINDAFGSFTPNPKGIAGDLRLEGIATDKLLSISQAIIDNMTNIPNFTLTPATPGVTVTDVEITL